jgi:hypothetical protein
MKNALMYHIALIESKIMIYSSRDLVRAGELQAQLNVLNMQLLELMTSEVELESQCQAFESFLNSLSEVA